MIVVFFHAVVVVVGVVVVVVVNCGSQLAVYTDESNVNGEWIHFIFFLFTMLMNMAITKY